MNGDAWNGIGKNDPSLTEELALSLEPNPWLGRNHGSGLPAANNRKSPQLIDRHSAEPATNADAPPLADHRRLGDRSG